MACAIHTSHPCIPFAQVADAQVVRDRTTGQSRGFGFVTFIDADVARTVQSSEHSFDGAPPRRAAAPNAFERAVPSAQAAP